MLTYKPGAAGLFCQPVNNRHFDSVITNSRAL